MTSGVPWQLRGVRPEVLDSVRDAARRAGMSVEAWLDTAIAESAKNTGNEPAQHRLPGFDPAPSRGSSFSDVTTRLDALARQVDRLTQVSANPAASPNWASAQYPTVGNDPYRPLDRVAGAPSIAGPDMTVDQALAEIEARQRMLDGGSAAAPMEFPRAPTQGLSDLEQQLRQINSRIASIRPCSLDTAVETLRDDLAEIGMMLKEAMPRRAIESLESEIRELSERIESERYSGAADSITIAGLERGLAELRDSLHTLTPAESLVGFDRAVQGLSEKVERIAGAGPDSETLKQFEGAIAALRGVVSHVASNDTLTQLSEEVRSLSAKVDQVAGSGAFSAMEERIKAIADALEQSRGAPAADTSSLETVVRSLSDKLDQLQAMHFDKTAINSLEARMGALVQKLDASDAHLGNLSAIERGLADLLIQMEGRRMAGGAGALDSADTDALKRDVRRTQDSLETVHGTLGHVVDRLATIESGIRERRSPRAAPAPDDFGPETAMATPAPSTPTAAARAPAAERRAIDPNLPPDHPLEPGGSRSAAHSPAERIAASEAALESIRPPVIPDPAGRSNFIAAARRAAQAATVEGSPVKPKRGPDAASESDDTSLSDKLGRNITKLVLAAGVALLVLGAVHFITTRLSLGTMSIGEPTATHATHEDAPAAEPSRVSVPSDRHSTTLPPGIQTSPNPFAFNAGVLPAPTDPLGDTTGSVRPAPASAVPFQTLPSTSLPQPPQPTLGAAGPGDRLPASIGGAGLRTAAVTGDAGAEFEIATRFADGRGVPQNLAEAAAWFERAASKGLVAAQFRLGGLYEKGMGVQKNIETARRLYTSAAEAGHPKAMHNLAVIYAEGAGGKPDYLTAARWFRKASDHGVVDSQYNLAILYARGVGIEPNLMEAFKWFALASREGDRDATKKRDDVAARLDKQSLAIAMDAAQAWQAEPQADAIEVHAPPGGWDAMPVPPAPPATKRSAAPKVDRQQPGRPTQLVPTQ